MNFTFASIIGVPTAAQCFQMLAPFAGIIAMFWFIGHADHWIRRLFPRPNWDEELGWLQIRAERKAHALLRWYGHGVHAMFVILLLGIVWGAVAVGRWNNLQDVLSTREVLLRLPVLAFSLTLCLVYIVGDLLPRLRREFDEEELVRFRAENPDEDALGRKVRSSRSLTAGHSLPESQKRDRKR